MGIRWCIIDRDEHAGIAESCHFRGTSLLADVRAFVCHELEYMRAAGYTGQSGLVCGYANVYCSEIAKKKG